MPILVLTAGCTTRPPRWPRLPSAITPYGARSGAGADLNQDNMQMSSEQIPERRGWRARPVLAVLATLIPVIPIVIGVLVTSSGGGGASATATAGFTPVSGQTLGPAPLSNN